MNNKIFKKALAIAMAGAMVMSSPLAAFAESTTGAGTSEGHVDKKATNVILPTSVANTTFAYTMDPERLIKATNGGRHAGSSFPAGTTEDPDTGVYFNNGTKGGDGDDKDDIVYKPSSILLDAVNKSSHAIDLTVKAEAVASSGGKDIPLVAKSALEDAEAASLYLGLKVGSAAAIAVDEEAAAEKTVALAGTDDNYRIAVKSDTSGYEYRVLTLAEWLKKNDKEVGEGKAYADNDAAQAAMDATWAATTFNIEGEVTDGSDDPDLEVEAGTTAPSIKVTWSWEDPAVAAAAAAEAAAAVTAAANSFKTTYAEVLALDAEDVTGSEEEQEAIAAAIEAFEELEDDVKTALATDEITAESLAALKAASDEAAEAASTPAVTAIVMTRVTDTGNVVGVIDSKPAGSLSAITINGTARNGQITQGNITYNATTGKLVIKQATVNNILNETGDYTIVATIGDNDYTFTYTKE